jgi:O-antigen ligase
MDKKMTPLILSFYLLAWVSLYNAHNYALAVPYLVLWGCGVMVYFIAKELPFNKVCNVISLSVLFATIIGICQGHGVTSLHVFAPGNIPQLTPPAITFSNKNMAAQWIALCLPFVFYSTFCTEIKWQRLLDLGAIGGSLYYLSLAGTRSAIVCVVVCAVIFGLSRLKGVYLWLTILFMIVCGIVFSGQIKDAALKGGTLKLRTAWVLNTTAMIKGNPFGVGLGNFKIEYPPYHNAVMLDWSLSEAKAVQRVHNDHVQICAELGIQGFIIWVSLLLTFFYNVLHYRNIRNTVVGLSVLSFVLIAGLSFPMERSCHVVMLFLSMGLLDINKKRKEIK